MSDYMTLMGADDVRAAGNRMMSAADEMKKAASEMSFAFEQHQRFLNDWLIQFQEALNSAQK